MLFFKPFNHPYEFIQISKPLGHSINLKPGETLKAEVIDILPSGGIVIKAKGVHITVQTEIPLRKDTQLLLKVMDSGESEKKLKLQIVSILDKSQIKPDFSKELTALTKNQLSEISFTETVYRYIPEVLNSKGKEKILDILMAIINSKDISVKFDILKNYNFFIHIKDINPEILEKIIKKSGILLETKLKNKDTEEDLKSEILKGKLRDETLKELIKQHQIVSALTGGLSTFLPVIWEDLKNSSLFFYRKKRKNRESFFCRIELNFKEIGLVSVDLFMFENDLMVKFFVENSSFKEKLRDKMYILKKNLEMHSFRHVFLSFVEKRISIKDIVSSEETLSLKI